ncbi:MAG: CBS domain-containing protein [Rhodospirillales bacterium]|nr:CBS domain-containing protein [Acetobacter sp.]
MKVKAAMTEKVEVVSPETLLQEAAQMMKSLDAGVLPVCDGERLVGMLTDRDMTVRAAAEGKDPKATHVSEAMSLEVVYCFEDQDVEEAADLMADKQIRRLPVLSRDKQLVGIVSLSDLAVEGTGKKNTGAALKNISQPAL